MGCSIHCQQAGAQCENWDLNLICSWVNQLLQVNHQKSAISMEDAIKSCSKTHYDAINMDEILQPFVGQPKAFCDFLQEKWGWIVTIDQDGKHILADENKEECVCPLVRAAAVKTPNLCNCSVGFAEHMFSKVFEKQVHAKVVSSVLRGDKHCIYEIVLD